MFRRDIFKLQKEVDKHFFYFFFADCTLYGQKLSLNPVAAYLALCARVS